MLWHLLIQVCTACVSSWCFCGPSDGHQCVLRHNLHGCSFVRMINTMCQVLKVPLKQLVYAVLCVLIHAVKDCKSACLKVLSYCVCWHMQHKQRADKFALNQASHLHVLRILMILSQSQLVLVACIYASTCRYTLGNAAMLRIKLFAPNANVAGGRVAPGIHMLTQSRVDDTQVVHVKCKIMEIWQQ